jgi:hypothetical protein
MIAVFGRSVARAARLDQRRAVSVFLARAAGRSLLAGKVAVASVGAQLALAA